MWKIYCDFLTQKGKKEEVGELGTDSVLEKTGKFYSIA